ncbi:hypothetical protein [Amycolatopsis regifaucium]|uniref:Uncharacterized protein n=1 Tax=Amycolatopsis regifaucium TaxID=546365 RepID=A0A154MS88_9PSEU|nr:hypothetical protein [Amycolatopsis regifaucium]KZB87194.1 hypothetical protein AVL48_21210 [Amycolatopsis regifaucium]OKA08023.1 hypothetical protein ATP06_0211970 [Amycolatopsis regifaucium]SFI36669.1 hypothetical protein SAMN04489731_11054 [Amycolatopsis regifaucium]
MLWLFGQIWLWLLISFALGCGVTWLMMRGDRREQATPASAAPEPERAAPVPAYADPDPGPVPVPLEAEQTQFIPPARVHDDDEPYDQEPEGHREGKLTPEPVRPAQVYHPREPEPVARNGGHGHEPEPVWPSDEDWPPGDRASEYRPGQGG